jgi:RND superfamily putative drug exporter
MVFAVLVDVLVMRILLGSAVMRLMGRAAWWAPGPLARFYTRFGIKETDAPADTEKPVPVGI